MSYGFPWWHRECNAPTWLPGSGWSLLTTLTAHRSCQQCCGDRPWEDSERHYRWQRNSPLYIHEFWIAGKLLHPVELLQCQRDPAAHCKIFIYYYYEVIIKISLSLQRILLCLIVLSSPQTREGGNVGVPSLKTKDWGAMKYTGRCTKLFRLPSPTGMPELLWKLMRRYKRDSDAQKAFSKSHRKHEAEQRPGVQKSHKRSSPWASSLFPCLADISCHCEGCFPFKGETPLPMTMCPPFQDQTRAPCSRHYGYCLGAR